MSHPITAHASAPQGSVSHLSSYTKETFVLPCIILCRTTSPLVSFAYDLLRRHVPCTVKGKDIGAGLKALVTRLKAVDLEDLKTKLSSWHTTETLRASNTRRSTERIDDQFACLCAIISKVSEIPTATPATVLASLDSLFSDDTPGSKVLLSTIHRAKGLEFPNVFILDREKTLPSRYATTHEARTQEKNLWYVAVTRAKENLYYINSNQWKTQ